jgi:hypothetical protein
VPITERKLLNILAVFSVGVGVVIVVLTTLVLIHLNDVPTARRDAARDSCTLIVGLARAAAGHDAKALKAANVYIARTPLHDCNTYARALVK